MVLESTLGRDMSQPLCCSVSTINRRFQRLRIYNVTESSAQAA